MICRIVLTKFVIDISLFQYVPKSSLIVLSNFIINNGIVSDDETIANSFNDYFVNVGKSLVHNIVSNVDPLSYVERSNEGITDIVITVDDVKQIVLHLNNSAAGHDDLPPSIMKQLCIKYCVPLAYN